VQTVGLSRALQTWRNKQLEALVPLVSFFVADHLVSVNHAFLVMRTSNKSHDIETVLHLEDRFVQRNN